MYDAFYGFNARPFALTPDPAFLYRSPQHSMALTLLEYGIVSQASFALLTGEIGSGKTTLLRYLIRSVGESATVALVSNTHSGFQSIHPWVAQALGVERREGGETVQYEAIVAALVREYARGRSTLLIIDEAQNLSPALLEELRLLSNVNSEKDLVLQTLLVGQPELRQTLLRPELRQFAQRISVDYHLKALDEKATAAYVRHRTDAAGAGREVFDADAVALIHSQARGVPRLINQLCDLALVYGYAEGEPVVTAATVRRALADREAAEALPVFGAAALDPVPEPRDLR